MAVGGLFVVMSALAGGDADAGLDADGDLALDVDADLEIGTDLDLDVGADLDMDAGACDAEIELSKDAALATGGLWMPFFSFRFWTFGSAFFGLSGTLFETMTSVSSSVALGVSSGLAVLVGSGVSYTLHKLRAQEIDSSLNVADLVGANAEVVLPIETSRLGKIRVVHAGHDTEFVARSSEESGPLGRGQEVMIIEMKGDIATVVDAASV